MKQDVIVDIFKTKVNRSVATQKQQIEQLPDFLKFVVDDETPTTPTEQIVSDLQDLQDLQGSEEQTQTFAQDSVETEQIIVPKSIMELQHDLSAQQIAIERRAEEKRKLMEFRNFKKVKSSEKEQINQTLTTNYQEQHPQLNVEEVDLVRVKSQINQIVDEIPDLEEDTLTDFIIETKKDKSGYIKEKVTIKSSIASKELSTLATIAKNESNGAVRHRVADIRLIGNTNKTQLRNSELKLFKISYTFKPVGGSVNKATRVMISVSPEFDTDKKLLVYIQQSRNKAIIEYEVWDAEDIQWLGKFIGNFFQMTFSLAEKVLRFKNNDDPLVPVLNKIIKTNEFRVMPLGKESRISSFMIESKSPKNQWLVVIVRPKVNKQGEYGVYLNSRIDKFWGHEIKLKSGTPITLRYLSSADFIDRLFDIYADSYTNLGVNQQAEDSKELFMVNKLTYRYLKQAFYEIFDSPEELEVKIGGTLSKKDTAVDLKKDYEAEAIIGKTKHLDYFILSYSAVQVIEGNSRVTKDGRNYHSRVYMFQLEYKDTDGVSGKFLAKTFQEIKDTTQFLTKKPKIVN